jgi:hypothetical protein
VSSTSNAKIRLDNGTVSVKISVLSALDGKISIEINYLNCMATGAIHI